MKIALTGSCGSVGSSVRALVPLQGHQLVCIDRVAAPDDDGLPFVQAEMTDYDALVAAFDGCDALIHLAAIPNPLRDPDHVIHANNVVGSYNALRAAVEVGIRRICQASSVNAIGLSFGRTGRFDYFPIDEAHPNHAEDAYALSKWICEAQADSLVRRYEDLAIASMRFHWVGPRPMAIERYDNLDPELAKNLWAHTDPAAAVDACLRSLTAPFTGHEVFYIVAPYTVSHLPSLDLAARFYPGVPVRGDLSGHRSFFDSSKAGRLLGWVHLPASGE
jgi:nucleoside-diphosphate-sugar epimerase